MEEAELEDGEVDETDPSADVEITKTSLPHERGQEVKTTTKLPALNAATATATSSVAPGAASGSGKNDRLLLFCAPAQVPNIICPFFSFTDSLS